jgi:hypothetical protein
MSTGIARPTGVPALAGMGLAKKTGGPMPAEAGTQVGTCTQIMRGRPLAERLFCPCSCDAPM